MARASMIISILATSITVVGLVPLLGAANWIALPLHVAGWLFGLLAVLFGAKDSENGVTALVLSFVFGIVSLVRLVVGFGVL